MNNELIVLEQLPVIRYQLEQLSKEIQKKVDKSTKLVANQDTVKDIKQVRANLNKEFKELEEQRKKVKSAIMAKYDEFNKIYVENVSSLYKNADVKLKEKIDSVENTLKQEKREELELFAKEHIEFNNLENIISFDDIGLNITLSASMKSLKDQIVEFTKKVSCDLECISSDEDRDEILYEYQHNGFNYQQAILTIRKRKEEINKLQEQHKEVQLQINEDAKVVEKVNEIVAPKEIIEDDEIIESSFKVKGTKEQIKKIKNLIIELGVEYE